MLLNHHNIYYSFADEPIFSVAMQCNAIFQNDKGIGWLCSPKHLHRESDPDTYAQNVKEGASVSMCCKSSELFMHLKVFSAHST